MYLHNNIPTYNKNYNNLILKYDWDFFITLTYDTNRKSETIRNHIENIYNKNYWIEYLIWVKEYTKSQLPHLHIIMKTKNKKQSYKTLQKIFRKFGHSHIQYIDDRNTYGEYIFKNSHQNNFDWDMYGLQKTIEDEKKLLREKYHKLILNPIN